MNLEPTPITSDEITLIGAAIYQAQKVEWALYGIASHVSHLPAAQRKKRFKQINPEAFLRDDPADFKATLGEITAVFGDAFLISSPELEEFVDDRNLIVHNFYRLFHANIRDGHRREDPVGFLQDFILRGQQWHSIVRGLLVCLQERAAEKEGRMEELSLRDEDYAHKVAYLAHATKVAERLLAKLDGQSTS
ncbi:hypothetical protein SAMN05428963_10749 [Consotaella salsifontis]|uniref:Uncharacterized protein n=2 Tax=Consotaella salsifontis TaxID=1365950 RepID=A0A1T4RMA9_9HYPH|nr:hypothetical protein SAMN05428963_10749 [Consotaella salsifontis]